MEQRQMTMMIELDERLAKQLMQIAKKEGRDINTFVQRTLEEVAKRYTEEEAFDALIDELMQEHAWLLAQLETR
jgi:predicted transcriptional regulator